MFSKLLYYKRPFLMIFLAGVFLGLAVNTRFQSVFFAGGMGLALLFTKKWADYKHASIDHMARIPAFGIPFVSTSGSKDIINAHARTFGPSWRMIVELTKDGPHAYGIYPGGQDGRPGSPYYRSMVLDWSQGKYNSLN